MHHWAPNVRESQLISPSPGSGFGFGLENPSVHAAAHKPLIRLPLPPSDPGTE
ncbi:hypothetical protein PAXRUDRAFT_22293 [Paxillus rubicundulus Ve08.2h10]|uniref:Uncharacterized protein n=1 Tax=Paxillus rubicundulus Ve08.2h10 TaxID=930991 RepID=A0A0D0BKJ4_9AGAM|nr:hypothetical protein PAXRUDRAFT_22293 [Paxillus rubicundulus Ve08.2h10]